MTKLDEVNATKKHFVKKKKNPVNLISEILFKFVDD